MFVNEAQGQMEGGEEEEMDATALRLENKVAIITGGAHGIGECIVRSFVKHGAKVVIVDVQDDLAELICQDLGADLVSFVHCDVTVESDVENAINTTIARHGKLDVMVNNAGITDGPKLSILDNDKTDFERVISVNLIGVIWLLQLQNQARAMIPKCSGSIITTASVCSITGGVASHAYTSSKHGVVGLAKNVAAELGKYQIRVNCISPHLILTPLAMKFFGLDENSTVYSNLKGKTLGPQDVANAALFLASDESEYMSGHNLVVDGGYSVLNPAFGLLENKVAIVTGGAQGIGECMVRTFVKHGAKVVILDIKDDLGELICQDLGVEFVSYVHCDVSIESDVENAINTTITRHGQLDIMVNNAGIIDEPKLSILDNNLADFERVINVNLTGVFLGTKHAARVMIPKCNGSIITHASVSSITGGLASHAYVSSKHGVVGLAKNVAAELGKYQIRVNCISPYVLPTPLAKQFFDMDENAIVYSNLKGKTLGPQDITNAALFLASNESGYMSGHNLVVDGGFSVLNPAFGLFSLDNRKA
ncbi:hypothetical protein OSB04_009130 [Centaurea solstitialis]|uniref:Uncharacterized protein n=1 Tax=Centaurea solstitialis TaxID=347529 RepID=A0AA38TN29_9ASTR|nr:hypothetical protein OSB04_009130 [Centaurea solstitialis]